jgi:hypothetical protein
MSLRRWICLELRLYSRRGCRSNSVFPLHLCNVGLHECGHDDVIEPRFQRWTHLFGELHQWLSLIGCFVSLGTSARRTRETGMPKVLAIFRKESPLERRPLTASTSTAARGLPMCFPIALAWASPARTRSAIRSRSNCATAPTI